MGRVLEPSLSGEAHYEQYRRQIETLAEKELRQQLEMVARLAVVTQPAAIRFLTAEAAEFLAQNSRLRLEIHQLQAALRWDEEELTG